MGMGKFTVTILLEKDDHLYFMCEFSSGDLDSFREIYFLNKTKSKIFFFCISHLREFARIFNVETTVSMNLEMNEVLRAVFIEKN